MNFRPRHRDEPEINLIAFIDVLLVVLIFLMLSTTFSKFNEMDVKLPVADAQRLRESPKEIIVSVSADGRYAINQQMLQDRTVAAVTAALSGAASADKDSMLIISADATAHHQAVITVMEAARRAGLAHISFATQSSSYAGAAP